MFVYVSCKFGFINGGMAGIMFQDITTLLLDPKAFKNTVDLFVERYKGKNISVVAGKKKLKEDKEKILFFLNESIFILLLLMC